MFVRCLFFSLGDAGVHVIQHELKQIPNLLVDIEFFQSIGDEVGDVAVTVVSCEKHISIVSQNWTRRKGRFYVEVK